MDDVFRLVSMRAERLAMHPLLGWLREARVPLDRRLAILPALAPFAMGYRDVCRLALRYPSPAGDLEAAINEHAAEDATHSRLFLQDWVALGLDEQLGWSTSDVLWWLFLAPETAATRRAATQILALPATDGGDPLVRGAWAEAIEACGAVFFTTAAPLAGQLTGSTGQEYLYLGDYHLARESGHIDSAELFAAQRLSDPQRAQATAAVNCIFGIFEQVFDAMLEYGTGYPAAGRLPERPRPTPRGRPSPRSRPGGQPGRLPPAGLQANASVERLLDERRARTARSPLFEWLRSAQPLPAHDRLAAVVPAWAMSIMGYRDLWTYALPRTGSDGSARHASAWAGELSGHSAVFLADWATLGLDGQPSRTASQALRWLYLDPQTEAQRGAMARFVRLAAGSASPLTRMWLLYILEASGEAWFTATGELAGDAERHLGGPLDYLAGRLEGPGPDGGRFRQKPLSQPERAQVTTMITEVFDEVDVQLGLTLAGASAPSLAGPCASS
jgi:hypothetical protein